VEGRHRDAAALYRRALAIREAAFGPDDPDVARSLDLLAAVLRSDGQPGEADRLEQRARTIRATQPSTPR
jgi:uncharacterized tellurite resistance protein B-like protein